MALTHRRGAHRSAIAAAATVLAVGLSGCTAEEGFDPQGWDAPGQNIQVGSVLIRYAHVAEPRGEPWKRGADVPAYLWLFNEGRELDRLVGASTPNASSVDIVDGQGKPLPGGVELPPNQLRQLEPGKEHLLLRDVRQVVRGGDFMKITLRFEKAGSGTFNIQAQVPVYDPSPTPSPTR